jgi:hypothetical protein
MNAGTRKRAAAAIVLLKALAAARLVHSEIILPDGRVFSDRLLDDCFEAGDGSEVVVLIMQARQTDAELRDALNRDYARTFVDVPGWTRTLGEWEARQPGLLPLG